MTNTKPAPRLLGGKRRRRRWVAEILTADERLLRREYFHTETAAEAALTFRKFLIHDGSFVLAPGADRVEFYATPDGLEPSGSPRVTILL